ncbi:MAG: hypothetical protein ACI91Q_002433 [Gammaproteobacteria bacterium]|jgi:hypothetical protein
MRIIDAPRAGWYPDPDGRERLRWWDGLDWTDIRRAPPSSAELTRAESLVPREPTDAEKRPYTDRPLGYGRQDAQEIIAEVRTAARQELDRAAEQFSQRATTAVRSFTPLITEYTSNFLRWVKIALGVVTVLFIAWLLFQAIASQSLFEWLGDRIDNLTEETVGVTTLIRTPLFAVLCDWCGATP